MKALIETESDRILGFTMFGASAGEVMTTVQMTMLAESPYTALRDTIITHQGDHREMEFFRKPHDLAVPTMAGAV
jgi:hypothetical protein